MDIQEYINRTHNGEAHWFVEEVSMPHHKRRVQDILEKKEYLSGQHKILKRGMETYNGKDFEPRKIVLQYCKTIVNFQTSYLLKNPISLTGVFRKSKIQRIAADLCIGTANAEDYDDLTPDSAFRSR
ncbi:phage portal protein [Brevibacillus sp. NSP2.1]|uniref:phage portal protein n=1 Tax=Brevibacillus sp. NSP2.1 TaxID=3003229 RepID=UPI001397A0EA|nr:phage portal protein [Brevibacillus sp. NSP2.1]QHZ55911.1 phage portal protein [Brevibacillus sp. NSP2.1]